MPGSGADRKVRRGDSVASAVIICLLAGIAIAVWRSGQAPPADTTAIVGAASGFEPSESLVEGYRLGRVLRYTEDTLYEYINGQAPYYVSFGFQALTVGEYEPAAGGPPLVADFYDMATRRNAFGIFTGSRSPEDEEVEIANDAVASGNMVAFWKGEFYVQVRALAESDESETVRRAAEAAASQIADERRGLAEFDAFPKDGLVVGSEAFYKSAPLGLGHLREAFTADYERDGRLYRLMFCDMADAVEAEQALKEQAAFVAAEADAGQAVWGTDKYVGPMLFMARGKVVAGCIGLDDRSEAETIVPQLLTSAEAILAQAGSADGGD